MYTGHKTLLSLLRKADFFKRKKCSIELTVLALFCHFYVWFKTFWMKQLVCTSEHCTANEWPVRIQYKCLVIIFVLFPRNKAVQPPYFQNRIIMFCLTIPSLIFLWEIFIFRNRYVYFAAAKYVNPSWKYMNHSQTCTWMWKLRLRPCSSQKRNT